MTRCWLARRRVACRSRADERVQDVTVCDVTGLGAQINDQPAIVWVVRIL